MKPKTPAKRVAANTHIAVSWEEFAEIKAYTDVLAAEFGVPVSPRAALLRAMRADKSARKIRP